MLEKNFGSSKSWTFSLAKCVCPYRSLQVYFFALFAVFGFLPTLPPPPPLIKEFGFTDGWENVGNFQLFVFCGSSEPALLEGDCCQQCIQSHQWLSRWVEWGRSIWPTHWSDSAGRQSPSPQFEDTKWWKKSSEDVVFGINPDDWYICYFYMGVHNRV